MPAVHLLLCALLLVTSPASTSTSGSSTATAADDFAHRVVGPSAELAHASADLFRAALASRRQRNADQDALVAEVLALDGEARIAADRLPAHDATRDETDELLRDLGAQAARVDDAIDRAPTTGDLRRAWDATRSAWKKLSDAAAGIAPPTASVPPQSTGSTTSSGSTSGQSGQSGSTGSTGSTSGSTSTADLISTIAEVRWAGTINPDLKLAGTFEGKGLTTGRIVVKDADGNIVQDDSTRLTSQIGLATTGKSTSTRVVVNWTYRFNNDELARGQNTIVVTVKDSRGLSASAETNLVRKTF